MKGADPAPAPKADPPAPAAPPSVRRRLAAMVYEGVLLFGVVVAAGLIYALATGQRHALQGATGLQATLAAVVGLYFVWLWTHGGQTLAMKTWQLRLVATDGAPLHTGRALARYLAAWIWFLPALAGVALSGLRGSAPAAAALAANVAVIALLARLHPSRQFLHDLLCGTRIVAARPPPRR
ncbi:MAG: RDD family protein [Burkholderiales bacterium]|nr:RDD family protein [Burkholderiales bacterium]